MLKQIIQPDMFGPEGRLGRSVIRPFGPSGSTALGGLVERDVGPVNRG
jgi:hypothetical protein